MNLTFHHDHTIIGEAISAIIFLILSISLVFGLVISPDSNNSIFWSIILSIFSTLQIISLVYREQLIILRACMAWTAGTIWTWFAFIILNNNLYVPIFILGAYNLYSFVRLSNQISIDWVKFFKE